MKRRLAALGLLAALLAPAVLGLAATPVGGHGSGHAPPGCPWKGDGPCPHGHDMGATGPAVAPCPADEAGSTPLLAASAMFPPPTTGDAAIDRPVEEPASPRAKSTTLRPPSAPEPPPPRATSPA